MSRIQTPRRRGRLFVIAAPSGAGKTSLVRALMDKEPQLRFSVSYTTRRQRPTERHGQDYFFVDTEEFERIRRAGGFLEHARVFDNFYATSREQVARSLEAGQDLILEIDWQGAKQVREAMPESVSVFILPPTRAALEERLRQRGTDSEEIIARRLRDAVADMSHWDEYDYVIVNKDFEECVEALRAVVQGRGEAFSRSRPGLRQAVEGLLV